MANVGKYTIDTCILWDIASVAIFNIMEQFHHQFVTLEPWSYIYIHGKKQVLSYSDHVGSKKNMEQHNLAGGWTNPFEKYYIVKLDHIPRVRGGNTKIFELPPPSNSNNSIWTNITSTMLQKISQRCFFFGTVVFRQARLARLINGILCSQP